MSDESFGESLATGLLCLVATIFLIIVVPLAVYPYSTWMDGEVDRWEQAEADRHYEVYREAMARVRKDVE